MNLSKKLILFFSILITNLANATIYGDDSFTELYEVASPEVQQVASAVAVLIRQNSIKSDFSLRSRTLEMANVCLSERFVEQPVTGFCTGTLISPTHILTASHCYNGIESICATAKWVFNYKFSQTTSENIQLHPDDVYGCKSIVQGHYVNNFDYKIIELDRPVFNIEPAEVQYDPLDDQDKEFYSVTSPRGLPLKFSTGNLRSNQEPNYFVSNLDLKRGSSGGPVFSAKTHRLVGIVAQGDIDYVLNEDKFCNAYNICDEDGCRGEYATRVSQIPDLEAIVNQGFDEFAETYPNIGF